MVGGIVMGVLSALPIISAGNVCCCLWVIVGGLVAAYVLQQNQSAPIGAGDGALVGLLAGLVGAVVHVGLGVVITILIGSREREIVQRILDMSPNIPPNVRDVMERFAHGEVSAAWFVIGPIVGLMFWSCVHSVFATIGGLLGAAIFKKNTPPGTIDVTPAGPTV
jgi:hypothetical protein